MISASSIKRQIIFDNLKAINAKELYNKGIGLHTIAIRAGSAGSVKAVEEWLELNGIKLPKTEDKRKTVKENDFWSKNKAETEREIELFREGYIHFIATDFGTFYWNAILRKLRYCPKIGRYTQMKCHSKPTAASKEKLIRDLELLFRIVKKPFLRW